MDGWIGNCQRSHQLCRMKPRHVGGPKRLLQCLSDGSVRLVETKSFTQHCDYIALSYCWGNSTAAMKTTRESVVGLRRRIPDESLPQLYREVVALARGINIAYIWIDSLCIIQDSPSDKEEEIMQMSNIFSGALVVVVAASASSPHDSLLRVKPQSDQSHTWRTAASLVGYMEMNLVPVKFRKRAKRAHFSTDATSGTPIYNRGWCFQEKQLASRCLVFCDDEVVWECRSCCKCECGGEQEHLSDGNAVNAQTSDFSPVVAMRPYRKRLFPFAEHEPFQLDETLRYFADAEAAYSFWKTAVANYSSRALTFQTDRLPAISAIASVVAEATEDHYLAGLWRGKLLAGLGWVAKKSAQDDPRGPRPYQEYIAPTWSWASLPIGACYFPRSYRAGHRHDPDLNALVLDARTTLDGENLYGGVSDAAISLSGFHCDAELTIPGRGVDAQLDFGHAEVQTVSLGTGDFQARDFQARDFRALDFMCVEPDTNDTNGGRLSRNSRWLRRVTDRQTVGQPASSGIVRLLWLEEDVSLILTPSRRRKGSYERLGIFVRPYERTGDFGQIKPLKMPKSVQRSSITLV